MTQLQNTTRSHVLGDPPGAKTYETFEMGMNKDEHTDRGLSSEKLNLFGRVE
ncbi:predicted protein [Sclerotinia sclerotiorum 1980 UF-70]|uniref:Uncharacterized protein n=1 Tax=Sclerotinia sclerotiorum (strain ATCC 18683 / 1980 / Ss-1) TaxID=665079 RepID=A7EIW7_SCLS1|nr:predicted protein [Sclerotinia sclerotiorum 1980 UF-70]EDO02783.1 predicted protein [Sclerotinia sclerotiorum 1980 UF-70]